MTLPSCPVHWHLNKRLALLALSLLIFGSAGASRAAPQPAARAAQTAAVPQTALARALDDALKLLAERKWDAGIEAFQKVLDLARVEKETYVEGRARLGLGYALFNKTQYPPAREHFEAALAYFQSIGEHERIARAQFMLGSIANLMGEAPKSRALFTQAAVSFKAAGNLAGQASALTNLDKHEEVIAIARKIGDKRIEAGAEHSWADQLFTQGRFAEAWPKLEDAAALYREVKAQEALATVYVSMGRLQRAHGHPQQAIPLYREAIRVQEELGAKVGLMQSWNALGVAYSFLNQPEESRQCYERGLRIAEETGSPRLIDFMRGALSSNLLEIGDYQGALPLLEAVIQRGADANLAFRYSGLADALLGLNRKEEALAAAHTSVNLAGPSHERIPAFLTRRAFVLRSLGRTADALADLERALAVIEERRAKLVPTDFMRRGFSEQHQSVYAQTIALQHDRGDFASALETAERARGRAFLDLLATRDAQAQTRAAGAIATDPRDPALASGGPGANAFPALTMRGSQSGTPPPAQRSGTGAALASTIAAAPLTPAQIQETAKRLRSTILTYWLSDRAIYVWAIPPSGAIQSARVDVLPARMAQLVRDGAGLAAPEAEAPTKQQTLAARGEGAIFGGATQKSALRELYKLLLEPVRKNLPSASGSRLTIVPHGLITRVPFAALVDARGRYLIEDFSLHYAPATALLSQPPKTRAANRSLANALLVADPDVSEDSTKLDRPLPRLPGARAEVRAIAALAVQPRMLMGAEAKEEAVRNAASEKSILHFATHAIVLDDRPFDSYLALARSGPGSSEDGRLTAEEVYGLTLDADLVVLSACRSGAGRITGDGIAALSRAFFYAGTPSVMVTLWDVADQPSKHLLPHFYRALARGEDKSRALRTAQLRLLRDLRAGRISVSTPAGNMTLPEAPLFWAGFILIGEP